MLPVNCGSHADYQNFLTENLRKYYPDPDVIARSTWDIIERFRTLNLSYTDELMRNKYSKFGPAPRTSSCVSCTCETHCSDAKYGCTVHLVVKDNPRLFNNSPGAAKNGNWNSIQEHLWNAQINVRK